MNLISEELKKIYIKYKLLPLALFLMAVSFGIVMAREYMPEINSMTPQIIVEMNPVDYINNTLLIESGINITVFIFTVLISVMAVYPDSQNDMIPLLSCSKNGKYKLPIIKLVITIVSVILFSLVVLSGEFFLVLGRYHLTGFYNDISTLMNFTDVNKQMTITNALVLKIGFKVLGYTSFAVMLMMIIKIFKKNISLSLTLGLSTIIVPLYLGDTVYNAERMYKLPIPLSAMLSEGFLHQTEKVLGKEAYYFKELAFKEITFVGVGIALLMLICAAIYLVISFGFKLNVHKKAVAPIALALCIILPFSGCTKINNEIKYEDTQNFVKIDSTYFLDKARESVISVNSTPMENKIIILIDGNLCFWRQNYNETNGFEIGVTDLNNFEERVLYKEGNLIDNDAFLGLYKLLPKINFRKSKRQLTVSEESWYYEGCLYTPNEDMLNSYNLKTGKSSQIKDLISYSVLKKGDKLCYNTENGLYVSDLDFKNTRLIDERIDGYNYVLSKDEAFFTTEEEPNKIYVSNKKEALYIGEADCYMLAAFEDKVLFHDTALNMICSITVNDSHKIEKLFEYPSDASILAIDNEKVYYYSNEEELKPDVVVHKY